MVNTSRPFGPRPTFRGLWSVLLWVGCASPATKPATEEESGEPTADLPDLELAERQITRLSLDLRGIRPSLEELDAAADPEQIELLRENFLADPRFGERIVSAANEVWDTVQDSPDHSAESFGLSDGPGFARAVGEEPLRLLAQVATEDRPWTEILTADHTRVDANLAAAWPVELISEPGPDGWRDARYTDGRPPAGVLVTNGLWWRYETSTNNASRGRANQISRILLCNDYLDEPVAFDRSLDLSDEAVMLEATRSNPGCVSCHASLDPLASLLGGVYFARKSGVTEMLYYHPEREGIWREQTGISPAYFGLPAENLADLATHIAADPAFASCTVEQTAQHLLRRPLTLDDTAATNRWRQRFLDGDLQMKELYRAITSDPLYLGDPDRERASHRKLVSPDQFASQLLALTGFRFEVDGADLLRTSEQGLAALAGGPDGEFTRGISQDWSATLALVQRRTAEAAAYHVVSLEPERLLSAEPSANLEQAALEAEIVRVHRQLLSRSPQPDELVALREHHAAVAAETGQEAAWVSLITVLLRDPDFLQY